MVVRTLVLFKLQRVHLSLQSVEGQLDPRATGDTGRPTVERLLEKGFPILDTGQVEDTFGKKPKGLAM